MVQIHEGIIRKIDDSEHGAGGLRDVVGDVYDNFAYDGSEVVKYLHTFIPQTKDEVSAELT